MALLSFGELSLTDVCDIHNVLLKYTIVLSDKEGGEAESRHNDFVFSDSC